jgi:hypothetical protein
LEIPVESLLASHPAHYPIESTPLQQAVSLLRVALYSSTAVQL